MWFEQFYSGVITTGFVAAAMYIAYPMNLLDTGHEHRRFLYGTWRQRLLKRDHRLTGNMYVLSGLESIPDATD